MNSLGIAWRRPGFWQFTSVTVLAIGLWMCLAGVASRIDPTLVRSDFACLLLAVWWPLAAMQVGLDPRGNWRAATLSFGSCGLLLALLQFVL